MNLRTRLAAMLLLFSFASLTSAQDKNAPTPGDPDMEAAMHAMMPGPEHVRLARLAGDWTYTSKLTMEGMPPEETEGTATITVVMDGRFLHEQSEGTMMGQPFQAAKLMGFNNGSRKYEAVWTYTMGTNMMTMTGTSDDNGKTIAMKAEWTNEVGARESVTITYRIADDDHFTVTLGGGKMPDGSAGPEMEVSYSRKKK